jgi:hypothetical protein
LLHACSHQFNTASGYCRINYCISLESGKLKLISNT